MQSIKLNPRGRWLLLLTAVAAVFGLAVLTAPRPSALVRYVGPPLKDGTRITFLHPASISMFLVSPYSKPPRPWIVQDVALKNPRMLSRAEAAWYKLPIAGPVPVRDVGVSVRATTVSKTYLAKHLIVSGRRQKQYALQPQPGHMVVGFYEYGSMNVDEVDIVDAPRGRQYTFSYYFLSNSQSPDFAAHKAAIVTSFQVLPPGAVPPAP